MATYLMGSGVSFLIEDDAFKPSLEMVAFEALWANGISSFKQLREKLKASNASSLGSLIDPSTAKRFYQQAVQLLHIATIN